jgi:hypothetical protein
MAGTLNVDTLKADSNLRLQIASANVAFIDASGLNMLGSNLVIGGSTITSTQLSQLNANGTISAAAIASVNASVATTGTLPSARLPAGTILQVVGTTTSSQTTTTTSTYVDTALSLSITPKFATSKILVTAYCGMCKKTAHDLQMNIQIVRDSTSIFIAAALNNDGAVLNATNPTLVYLDSPATTSATTYKLQISDRDNVGTVTFNNNGTATITLMEIAA